jgi:FHS family Na+ dependent glucose MFS transporter 1
VSLNRTVVVATAVYFATYVLIGALGGTVGPTLGPFAAQVGVGLSTIGIILTTRSLGYLAGALGSTRWMDKIRVHRGLAALSLLAGVALATLPWARSFGLLVFLVVPLGLATAGLDVGVSTMLLRAHRDRAAPFLVAAFAIGKETSVYLLLAAGFAVLALVYLSLPEMPRQPTTTTAEDATKPAAAERDPLASYPSVAPRQLGHGFLTATLVVAQKRLKSGFLAATTVILFYVGAEIGFASWLYVFVNLQFGTPIATAVTGAFWAAFSLARLGAVFAARRFAPERILAVAFASGLAFALLLVLAPHALVAVWIGAIGVGASVGPIYPNVITAYSHRFELTGKRFGAIAVASCTGSMVFPWLIGRLLDVGGTVVVPATTAALLVVAAGAAWTFLQRRPRHPDETPLAENGR